MKEIIKNIKKNALFDLIKSIIPAIIICGIGIFFAYYTFKDGFDGEFMFLTAISMFFGIAFLIVAIKNIKLLINPFSSPVFKKYGDVETLEKIFIEIENTTEIESGSMIISQNYISDKEVVEKLVAIKDILAVHKLVHKTNFITDYYKIVITDKFGEELHFVFNEKEEKAVNSLIAIIGKKAPNAVVGYTQAELDHIRKNKIPLKNYSVENEQNKTDKKSTISKSSQPPKEKEYTEAVIKHSQQNYTIQSFADAIIKLSLNEISKIENMCLERHISYKENKLVVATFAYFYAVWLINFGNITLYQSDKVELIYKENFSKYNRTRFENASFKEVLYNETLLEEKIKILQRKVLDSYHKNNRNFIDEGLSDEFILEFICEENSKEVLKKDVSFRICNIWSVIAKESGEKMSIVD